LNIQTFDDDASSNHTQIRLKRHPAAISAQVVAATIDAASAGLSRENIGEHNAPLAHLIFSYLPSVGTQKFFRASLSEG
jgi:hypothetical protein